MINSFRRGEIPINRKNNHQKKGGAPQITHITHIYKTFGKYQSCMKHIFFLLLNIDQIHFYGEKRITDKLKINSFKSWDGCHIQRVGLIVNSMESLLDNL